MTTRSKEKAAENHERLTRTVEKVVFQRARHVASSIPGQLSLVFE